MLRLSLLLFIAGLAPASAQSGTFDDKVYACFTKSALDESYAATRNNDIRQFRYLFDAGKCFSADKLEYSVISPGLLTTKVRVYKGSHSVVAWTRPEYAR